MININTMDKLEKLNIGSDIDKLENYAAMIKRSELMGNCIVDNTKKDKIFGILGETKKNSDLLKYDWDMQKEPMDDFDKLFEQYGRFKGIEITELDSESLAPLADNISDIKDVFAYALPDGIDIRIVYRKGIYYRSYTYYNNGKGLDITDHIRNLVPYNIQEITSTGLIELQARITMTDTAMKECDIKEEEKLYFIVNYLSNSFCTEYIDKFKVKVYKMYCDDEDSQSDTLWDEYELLGETELDLVENGIIREIDRTDLGKAILELQNYFESLEDKEYNYTELTICINDMPDSEKLTVSKKNRQRYIYCTTVQEVKWIPDIYSVKPKIEIKPVLTKSDKTITNIVLDNIEVIHKIDITRGNKIYFYVDYCDNIVLCNEQGESLV